MIEYDPMYPGFKKRSVLLYGFGRGTDTSQYLSDFGRETAKEIHRPFAKYANDKTILREVLSSFPGVPVRTFGVIQDHEYYGWEVKDAFWKVILDNEIVVVKPRRGSDGEGIKVCRAVDRNSAVLLARTMLNQNNQVVTEYLRQHALPAKIWPHSTNTIRMFVMRDVDMKFFLVRAVHRFGTEVSDTTDNWEQGGLSSLIDPETGVLGQAAQETKNGAAWHYAHPQSGVTIAGVEIPDWQAIRDTVLEMSQAIPYFDHIGWDVVLTEDGMRVLEINANTGMRSLQVHGGILKDSRVREYYASNQVFGVEKAYAS